jgi:predicted transcriptional regulator
MTGTYKALSFSNIARGCGVKSGTHTRQTKVSLDAPASQVMTDFNLITPYAIGATAAIDAVNRKMIACGVRMLFVTDADDTLVGLITATDVLGEKPVQYIHDHGGNREDILAQDIMTASDKLQAITLEDVENTTVGDMIETMKAFQRQHLLVIEKCGNYEAGECIRGMFSTSQISKQTGIEVTPSERATSFADIEKAIASS